MIFIGLFLALVAFVETVVFLYLRRQVRKLGAIKIATHQRHSEAEALFEEAHHKHEEAESMYNEAKWLVVQAKAGEDLPLPH